MNTISLFSAPIWESKLPDYDTSKNDYLNIIQKYKEEIDKNNTLQIKELDPLFGFICNFAEYASNFTLENCKIGISSVNFLNSENYSNDLDHLKTNQNTFTGIFCLKSSDENKTELKLLNPGMNKLWQGCHLSSVKNDFTSRFIKISLEEGNMFMWPSYYDFNLENFKDDNNLFLEFNVVLMNEKWSQA